MAQKIIFQMDHMAYRLILLMKCIRYCRMEAMRPYHSPGIGLHVQNASISLIGCGLRPG